jgi:hypothetical protein
MATFVTINWNNYMLKYKTVTPKCYVHKNYTVFIGLTTCTQIYVLLNMEWSVTTSCIH